MMTQDETNKLMGEAAAELQSVRNKLHCLTTKAERYIKVLEQASSCLKDSIGDSRFHDISAPNANDWPVMDQIDDLCREINEARTRRHKLTERMREWGVID